MMGEFMHGDMGDKLGKGDITAGVPLIKDRFAKQPYGVGPSGEIEHGFLGHRDALVKPGKLKGGIVDGEVAQHCRVGPIGNAQKHRARRAEKRRGKMRDGIAGDLFDGVKRGRPAWRGK